MSACVHQVASLAHLFYLHGCFVHVLDLLVEDIAKHAVLSDLATEAHSVVSFVKGHSLLYEEFLQAKQGL